MKKLFLLSFLLLFSLVFASAEWEYQETHDTASNPDVPDGTRDYIYLNWTKVTNAVTANWSIEIVENTASTPYTKRTKTNLTLTDACFDNEETQIQVRYDYYVGGSGSTFRDTYQCYNGTDWHVLQYREMLGVSGACSVVTYSVDEPENTYDGSYASGSARHSSSRTGQSYSGKWFYYDPISCGDSTTEPSGVVDTGIWWETQCQPTTGECGDDGCGASLGTCDQGYGCNLGTCEVVIGGGSSVSDNYNDGDSLSVNQTEVVDTNLLTQQSAFSTGVKGVSFFKGISNFFKAFWNTITFWN